LERALELIHDLLKDGPRSVEDDIEPALALAGVSVTTARRAYGALKVHSFKDGYQGRWCRALPGDPACRCPRCRGVSPRQAHEMSAFEQTPSERATSSKVLNEHLCTDGSPAQPEAPKALNEHLWEAPTESSTSPKGAHSGGETGIGSLPTAS